MIEKLNNCTQDSEQRESCVYTNKIHVCLECKRYYINTPDDLKDLYYNAKEIITEIQEQQKPKIDEEPVDSISVSSLLGINMSEEDTKHIATFSILDERTNK